MHKCIIWHSYALEVVMKYVMAAFMLVILLMGCTPSGNTVPIQPQTPGAVDNKSIQSLPPVVQPTDNKTTQAIDVVVNPDMTENALKSTVLIFSTNQLEMEKAKNNFWDGIELIKPIITERQVTNYTDIFTRNWKQGTGVLIDENGYILTSRYNIEDCDYPCGRSIALVASGAQLIYVFMPEANGAIKIERGQEYIATVICKHPQDDLAIIKITPRNGVLPYCTTGDSDSIKRSEGVTAIGYPSDLLYMDSQSAYKWKTGTVDLVCESTITDGIVSAKRKFDTYPVNYTMDELNADYSVNVIQTDADINFGNSGGPLIDKSGKIVGIVVVKVFGNAGLGFAIAINEAKDLIKAALARPIEGISDGAFLSCVGCGYCCNQSSWESNPARRCNVMCEGYATNEAKAACWQRCQEIAR